MLMQGGYDLKVGTSERGSVDSADALRLPAFNHAIIMFGGPKGLEDCWRLDQSEAAKSSGVESLFDMWLNTCPGQGCRTIRTEEALLISLSYLQPALMACGLRTQ